MRLNRMLYHGNQYSPYVSHILKILNLSLKIVNREVISVRVLKVTTAFSFTFTIGGIYDELKKWLRLKM